MMSCVRRALFSREPRFEPPLSMMLITAVHADLLEDVICVFFNRGPLYNLLLAFPAVTEHADPEPPTLLVDNFGGEWVWDRLGLLKGCFVFSLSISLYLYTTKLLLVMLLLFLPYRSRSRVCQL